MSSSDYVVIFVMHEQWLLLVKSFEVRFNATEKSCDSCIEFQALAIRCQVAFLAKTELQRGSGITSGLQRRTKLYIVKAK